MYSLDFKRHINIHLIILSLFLFSCGASKQYQIASTLGTIHAYESFLEEYSKSSYAQPAAIRLNALYEIRDWNYAKKSNTSLSYSNYIESYPKGKNIQEARRRLINAEKKERESLAWQKAVSINTTSGYNQFLRQNPYSTYSSSAKSAIKKILTTDWDKAKSQNSIEGYHDFIGNHPNSDFASLARKNIININDRTAWSNVSSANTISSYNQYLKSFPSGLYSANAKSRIKEIEEMKYILPAWKRTQSLNTYQAYQSFIYQYPKSSYAYQAKSKLQQFESAAWYRAQSQNTIAGYKTFLNNYPDSDQSDIARKKVIDLEVDNIFKGDYGYLPPMNKTSSYGYGQTRPTTNTIEIHNDTAYELTVWYSGTTSKKIVLDPSRSTSFVLPNGPYKVAASVKATNVTKYAGNERLDGGDYESKFYIETRSGFSF